MEIKQLNVDFVFLYGNLSKEIYFEQLKGFQINGVNREMLVCKLQKTIYKLKQVCRIWWKLIDSKLKELGFTNIGLMFGGSGNQQLFEFADADYANCT